MSRPSGSVAGFSAVQMRRVRARGLAGVCPPACFRIGRLRSSLLVDIAVGFEVGAKVTAVMLVGLLRESLRSCSCGGAR